MIFKVVYKPANGYAGHIMCRVFSSPAPNRTWANLGVLICRREEFESMRAAMSGVDFQPDPTEGKKA